MENSSQTPQNGLDAAVMPQRFFKKPGNSSGITHRKSQSGGSFNSHYVGSSRSVRVDIIIASALRDAGVSNPVILPRSVTRR